MEFYNIKKESSNNYIFFNKKNVEYQVIIKKSGIIYKDNDNNLKNILELVLNCDINTASKDYKTIKTLAKIFDEISDTSDAIFMQIHNQPENISNNKIKRRGLSRIKLWSRALNYYFENYILFTNLLLNPNKNSDLFGIFIKKDSVYYNQFVTNFYRFCYLKMYSK